MLIQMGNKMRRSEIHIIIKHLVLGYNVCHHKKCKMSITTTGGGKRERKR